MPSVFRVDFEKKVEGDGSSEDGDWFHESWHVVAESVEDAISRLKASQKGLQFRREDFGRAKWSTVTEVVIEAVNRVCSLDLP